MNNTILLLINWGLLAVMTYGIITALIRLAKGTKKPLRVGLEAILISLFFSFCISIWNTGMPVWIWWVTSGLLGIIAALMVIHAAKFPNTKHQ